jgi:hypothetical protein
LTMYPYSLLQLKLDKLKPSRRLQRGNSSKE